MYLHDKPREILNRLNQTLDQELSNLCIWKNQLISSQKYELASEFNILLKEMENLQSRICKIIKNKDETPNEEANI